MKRQEDANILNVRVNQRNLARIYIENQMYSGMYPLNEGFKKGTIFPQLYRPYQGKNNKQL